MSFLSPMFTKLRSLMTKAPSLPVATAQPGSTAGQASPTAPPKKPKMTTTLLTQAELYKFFGNPGKGPTEADPKWVKANILTCRDGNGDKPSMPGVPKKFYFMTHKLIEAEMRAAFADAMEAMRVFDDAAIVKDPSHKRFEIETAASFVYRHKRHDPKRDLSEHSWASAVDINSGTNQARTIKGKLPKPWSPEWMKLWPDGLPQPFVEAWVARGWCWGGYWTSGGYIDPMHFVVSRELVERLGLK